MPMGRRHLKPMYIKPFDYMLYLCVGEEEFDDLCKRQAFEPGATPSSSHGLAFNMVQTNGVYFTLMYLEDNVDEKYIYHEALHCVHYMMDFMGIPINKANTEVQTYFQTYIVEIIKEEMKKRGH